MDVLKLLEPSLVASLTSAFPIPWRPLNASSVKLGATAFPLVSFAVAHLHGFADLSAHHHLHRTQTKTDLNPNPLSVQPVSYFMKPKDQPSPPQEVSPQPQGTPRRLEEVGVGKTFAL